MIDLEEAVPGDQRILQIQEHNILLNKILADPTEIIGVGFFDFESQGAYSLEKNSEG